MQAGNLAHNGVTHADFEADELVLIPAFVVVLVQFFRLDEQFGAAQGFGLVAGLDAFKAQQQDVLVPAGTVHGQRPYGGRLNREFRARNEAVLRRVGQDLDGHLTADAVWFSDSCHLKLHLFLCSGVRSVLVLPGACCRAGFC